MNRRYIFLLVILAVVVFGVWMNIPNGNPIKLGDFERSRDVQLGLDLRGGVQVLLEADLPAETEVDAQALNDAVSILENRSNALGVSEVVFQAAGTRRIVGEFPGLTNPDEVIATIQEVGQLEFVDMGDNPVEPGTIIKTDYLQSTTDTAPATEPTAAAGTEATAVPEDKVYHTVMTGTELSSVNVTRLQTGAYVVEFQLKADGAQTFAEYTSANIGKYLAIVLDKNVISTPTISSAITEGSGYIEGQFTYESANALAVQLRYGSLPIPLKVVETKVIGPTLGQDSLNKSLIAGIIGFLIVISFMAIYYRLPGVVADVAIIIFALITLTVYKLIPVTLTLPGIAGFLLSTGSALDANILIFERLKEELRAGRNLRTAIQMGWQRAWPSIRDSNIAAIITCAILFWFGSSFGATIVKGFALTLFLGVIISLFTAIVVTRSLLNLVTDWIDPSKHSKWFGA